MFSQFVFSVLLHVDRFDEHWNDREYLTENRNHVCVSCTENFYTFTNKSTLFP